MSTLEVVRDLNNEMYERHGADFSMRFSLVTDGDIELITFEHVTLWNNDDDDREFIEVENEYSDLTTHIRKKFNELIDSLVPLKFSI